MIRGASTHNAQEIRIGRLVLKPAEDGARLYFLRDDGYVVPARPEDAATIIAYLRRIVEAVDVNPIVASKTRCPHGDAWDDCPDCRH